MGKLKIIQHSQATKDGIIYYSPSGTKACMCSLKDDGTIERTLMPLIPPFLPRTFVDMEEFENTFSYLKLAIFDVLFIILAIIMHDKARFIAITMFSLFTSIELFKVFHVSWQLKTNVEYFSMAKFIAANHMATNAYLKYQRIPTFKEVKNSSRFSADNVINYTFAKILIHLSIEISIFFLAEISVLIPILVGIISVFLFYFLAIIGGLNFLQIFITLTPSDKELKVALECVKCFEEMEKNVKVRYEE